MLLTVSYSMTSALVQSHAIQPSKQQTTWNQKNSDKPTQHYVVKTILTICRNSTNQHSIGAS